MNEIRQNFVKLKQMVSRANHVLLCTHERPDGDAVGSILAFSCFLEELGKKHVCYTKEKLIDAYFFLPGIEKIKNELKENIESFDLIVFIDAGDIRRTSISGLLGKINKKNTSLVNIDHHLTMTDKSDDFIDLNIISLEASSAAEIIYLFFDQEKININKERATDLLTGILTDTGCFSNLGTTVSSFSIAAQLLNRGVNIKKICDNTMKNKNITSLRLWGRALARLEKNEKTGVVTAIITQKDLKECGAENESTEGISNFLNSLSGATFTLLLKEEKNGKVKGSLRTTKEDVDVSKIAARFGGGGHKKAAGFSIEGRLKKTDHGWKVV